MVRGAPQASGLTVASYVVVFRPEAEAEVLEARQWYESRSEGLGRRFAAFERDGYQRLEMPLNRRASAAVWGNLAFGALAPNPLNGPNGLSDDPWSRSQQVTFALVLPAIGAGIDVLSGAAYEAPRRVHVVLTAIPPRGAPAAQTPPRRQPKREPAWQIPRTLR